RRVVTDAADFIRVYFDMPVRVEKDLPLSLIPRKARRRDPAFGVEQVLTGYVLDELLKPRLPVDAFAYIAFTASDLWPGEGWNFVFGQASLRERVGVWSIHRFGDPSADDAAFRLTLRRTLQTGTHELGHMFSMLHCTRYECNMCGSNSLGESDRRPLTLCPECVAKVCWATSQDPVERYRRLAAFAEKHGLKPQVEQYRRRLDALTAE
ncbi:MAG TPA: archaemetzincin, partial [Planctomycetota bacterium]|nr:archaemetzincin [Planctomycetota bacterium]